MKGFIFAIGLGLISCMGKSGDDNSHLRNAQNPNTHSKNFKEPDSLSLNNSYFYKLENDLLLNGRYVLDTFILENCLGSCGRADSIHRGGAEIIEEFGVDDFDLFYGKSSIFAGHGQILSINIKDKHLTLNTIGIQSSRHKMNEILRLNFPKKDTVKCLGIGDDIYYFVFNEKSVITSIEYYAAPL